MACVTCTIREEVLVWTPLMLSVSRKQVLLELLHSKSYYLSGHQMHHRRRSLSSRRDSRTIVLINTNSHLLDKSASITGSSLRKGRFRELLPNSEATILYDSATPATRTLLACLQLVNRPLKLVRFSSKFMISDP
jgi:hypothetical protein